jgi:hypothetical protein
MSVEAPLTYDEIEYNTITLHRFGVLIYDCKAKVKVLKGKPQVLDP